MFENVLIPTDFSPYIHKVLECIGDLPGVKRAVLLNIVTRPTLTRIWDPLEDIKEAESKLSAEKNYIKKDIEIKTRAVSVLGSNIASAMQKVVEEENVSLVVMGAHGKSLIQSMLLGSVSRNVLRFGDRHLLIMRFKTKPNEMGLRFPGAKGTKGFYDESRDPSKMEKFCEGLFSRVLVPTDFSMPEEAAISFLKSLDGIGEILLLHVVSKGETKEEIESLQKEAENMLSSLVDGLRNGGMKASSYVRIGNPVEEIQSLANEKDVSLIALSSVGKDTMHTGRIGSRTYDVANTATRPVLVIRMRPVFAVPAM